VRKGGRVRNRPFTTRGNNGSDIPLKIGNFAAGCRTVEPRESNAPRPCYRRPIRCTRDDFHLRINHFEIVEAASAAAALQAFEEQAFDLAIVDIFLQGTNGSDLIGTLRERMPDLPVVAISGMTALDFLSASPGLSDVACPQKPFRPHDLMRAIEVARGAVRSPAAAAL
jgi:CheY-like chemotaxis protein